MRRLLPALVVCAALALVAALLWWLVTPPAAPQEGGRTFARVNHVEADAAAVPVAEVDAALPAEWPEDAPRTVLGTVTDAEGQPVPRALVILEPEPEGSPSRRTRTDAQGRYRVAHVPAVLRVARFQAAGYGDLELRPGRLARAARVTLDASLPRLPGLRGVVRSPDGPAGGAFVALQRLGSRGFEARTFADAEGRFFLPFDEQADLMLSASHSHHGRTEMPVALPDERLITLDLPGGGYLEGRVVDERGQPIARFSVATTPTAFGGGAPPTQSFDDPQGRFRIGPVAAGRLRLQGAAEGHQPGSSDDIELAGGATVSGLELRLPRSASLSGQVTDRRTGRPIAGAQVVPAEWGSATLADMVGTETDADGRYRLTALPGRRSSIQVTAEGYLPLMLGGVEGAPGEDQVRDFALTPGGDGGPRGELTGVGAVLRGHRDGVVIDQLVEGGPAESALIAGDVVMEVDGRSARQMGMGGVANAIRGEEGTEVQLLIRREGEPEPLLVVLQRGRVAMPPPRVMPPNHN